MILERRLVPVIIEADSKVVVDVLNAFDRPISSLALSLIEDCRSLLHLLGRPAVNHIFREAKGVADFLAKNVVNSFTELVVFDTPPHGVQLLLLYDILGHTLPRHVNSIR